MASRQLLGGSALPAPDLREAAVGKHHGELTVPMAPYLASSRHAAVAEGVVAVAEGIGLDEGAQSHSLGMGVEGLPVAAVADRAVVEEVPDSWLVVGRYKSSRLPQGCWACEWGWKGMGRMAGGEEADCIRQGSAGGTPLRASPQACDRNNAPRLRVWHEDLGGYRACSWPLHTFVLVWDAECRCYHRALEFEALGG